MQLTRSFNLANSLIFFSIYIMAQSLLGTELTQEVYVWQNRPTPTLTKSMDWASPWFSKINLLWREYKFNETQKDLTESTAWRVSAKTLKSPFALSVRIASIRIWQTSSIGASICQDFKKEEHKYEQLKELQIDFDAKVGQITDYHVFLSTLKTCIAPAVLTFTALPSWIQEPAFSNLAHDLPNYVLQLHYLRKNSQGTFELYQSDEARRYFNRAEQLGIPFRVALPTYSYFLLSDDKDQTVGIEAEGERRFLNAGARRESVSPDFNAITEDIVYFREHSKFLRGIIWFRLPVASDENTISLSGFDKLIRGEKIRNGSIELLVRPAKNDLFDIEAVARGDFAAHLPRQIQLHIKRGKFVTWDFFGPCQKQAVGADIMEIICNDKDARTFWLKPGSHQKIGWIRTNGTSEVTYAIHE
jgi:Protein of unknown function (DUF3142)